LADRPETGANRVWTLLVHIDLPSYLLGHQKLCRLALVLGHALSYAAFMAKLRLYVDAALGQGQQVALTRDHAHYLKVVMRQSEGDVIELFNGKDGAWDARIGHLSKREAHAICDHQKNLQYDPPDLWVLFAPIKKARTDFIVEKATEMGTRRIIPVHTDFTNSERIRLDRLQAHAIEAAEQCGGTFVPEVTALQKLSDCLGRWDKTRQIMFCDETYGQTPMALPKLQKGPWAILIGPEGGFSDAERQHLHTKDHIHPTPLGPRILRADTAVVAAMTLWHLHYGDWL